MYEGGETLTILGQHFGQTTPTVFVGSKSCHVTDSSQVNITCILPAQKPGDRTSLLLARAGQRGGESQISTGEGQAEYKRCENGDGPTADSTGCQPCPPGQFTSWEGCQACENNEVPNDQLTG